MSRARMHDNVTGSLLDNRLVQIARNEELSEIRRRGIYSKVPISQCMQITGKKSIKVRFVDVNKGAEPCPNYKSRLVAQEFRDWTPSLFAATPPLEALKTLVRLAVASQGKRQVGFIDIKKAHLYAKGTRDVFIEIPPGDCTEGMCGKLNYTLHGTRDAAHNLEKECTGTLQDMVLWLGKLRPVCSATQVATSIFWYMEMTLLYWGQAGTSSGCMICWLQNMN